MLRSAADTAQPTARNDPVCLNGYSPSWEPSRDGPTRGDPLTKPMPFAREAGNGPCVVCLHCNASSSSQWRELMVSLAPRFRVLAPDLYGSGKSANWPSDRTISLKDEVAFIEPVLPTGDSFSIVGHSHGAAVGLLLALAHPRRLAFKLLFTRLRGLEVSIEHSIPAGCGRPSSERSTRLDVSFM